MLIGNYENYEEVSDLAELFGPGRRIYKFETEPSFQLPKPKIGVGSPDQLRKIEFIPEINLCIMKISNALVLPRKILIDVDFNELLIDSFKKLVPNFQMMDERHFDTKIVNNRTMAAAAKRISGYTFFGTSSSNGFGHITLEAFSNFYAFKEISDKINRVIVTKKHNYYTDIFSALGVSTGMRLSSKRAYFCENLIIPRQSYILDRSVSHRYFEVINSIKSVYLGKVRGSGSRIYVSRRNAEKRRLIQEPEIEVLFQRHGFNVIYPEKMSLAEQINAFAGAEIIAGPIGSALYNAVYSNPDVERIILASSAFYTPNDLLFCKNLSRAPIYCFGRSVYPGESESISSDWSIDTIEVEKFLHECFSAQAERAETLGRG